MWGGHGWHASLTYVSERGAAQEREAEEKSRESGPEVEPHAALSVHILGYRPGRVRNARTVALMRRNRRGNVPLGGPRCLGHVSRVFRCSEASVGRPLEPVLLDVYAIQQRALYAS